MPATLQLLDEIRSSLPVYAPMLAEMITDATEITTKGKAAIALGMEDRDEENKAVLADLDKTVADFVKRYQHLRDQMMSDTAAISVQINAQTWSTIYTTLGVSVVGLLLGMTGAGLMASRGITRPLSQLREQMHQLAA